VVSAYQTTLETAVTCDGVGVHTGQPVTLSLWPAPAGTGVVFRRSDLAAEGAPDRARQLERASIPARFDRVTDTRLCTTLSNEHGASVGTVEHLMAALLGCGVDNAVAEVDGPELPIMDGSASPFVALIESAGLRVHKTPARRIRVLRDVCVRDGDRSVCVRPADAFTAEVGIEFADPAIGRQTRTFTLDPHQFRTELARARTFGFLEEVEALRRAGLARGGSFENAVVVDNGRVLNESGLRYVDEFVRHKALDLIGDLYLAGAPIVGRIVGEKPGHDLNNRLLRELFATEDAWRIEDAPQAEDEAAQTWGDPARKEAVA